MNNQKFFLNDRFSNRRRGPEQLRRIIERLVIA
jgi:hypothetical protein